MMSSVAYLALGLVTGVFGGAFGIGGATVMIPAFVMLCGMSQHQAQGTALGALLPPVFILAVLRYYYEGHVNVPVAVLVAIGFTFGGLLGAHFVQGIPDLYLKRAFGIYLLIIGIRYLFIK